MSSPVPSNALELRPFCHYSASVMKPEFISDTPAGRRVIAGVRGARFTGPDISASQWGESAADWLLTRPDGTAEPNVRLTLRTDDGAQLFVQYQGRADWSEGIGSGPVLVAMTIETGDERYAWMNKALFVGKGALEGDTVSYEVLQLI